MEYKVGQVYYLVGQETAKVIPFRIVEEITRTTLEGVEKSYIAELPDSERTRVEIEKLKGPVFDNVRSLKNHMMLNAKNAIQAMIDSATKISEGVFNEDVYKDVDDIVEEKIENIELPDAQISNSGPNSKPANFKVLDKDEAVIEKVQDDEAGDIVKVDIGNGIVANMKVDDLQKVVQP